MRRPNEGRQVSRLLRPSAPAGLIESPGVEASASGGRIPGSEDFMNKPCSKCAAYDETQGVCGVLIKLQALHLNRATPPQDQDEMLMRRAEQFDDLLLRRPCRFSLHIMHLAGYFIKKRGLRLQDRPDIHNEVVASLLKLDLRPITPTYDDFRRYVTTMTRSAVHHTYAGTYGAHCCGTCTFYQEGDKRCGCHDLTPVDGRSFIHVNYNTKPRDVLHNSMFFLNREDVLDWTVLCLRLNREGGRATPSPGRRIWELLSTEMRGEVLRAAQTNDIGKIFKFGLVNALNEMLGRRDFYQEDYFRDIELAGEAKDLLGGGRNDLSAEEARRLNRLLLEASYPQEIAGSRRGCTHYSPWQFVNINEMESMKTSDESGIGDALKHLESLGPRQHRLAGLLRMMLEGYAVAEIAERTGRHRTTIPKELNGTTERERDELGREITYHQSGAIQLFQAVYTGAHFALERRKPHLWVVVSRRDFGPDAVLPSFNKISNELSISKREAIARYIEGWNQLTTQKPKRGDNMRGFEDDENMRGFEDDEGESTPTFPRFTRPIARMNEMAHPDYYIMLTYAEGGFDRATRRRIAGHLLICAKCSTELRQLDSEVIPQAGRPSGIVMLARWLTARATGRVRSASDLAQRHASAPSPGRVTGWLGRWPRPASLIYGLILLVAGASLALMLSEARSRSGLNKRLASLSAVVDALQQQGESLRRENVAQRDRVEQTANDAEQSRRRLIETQAALELVLAQLKSEKARHKTPIARPSAPAEILVELQDTSGLVSVNSDRVVSLRTTTDEAARALPSSLSEPVRELVTTGVVTPQEPGLVAAASKSGSATRSTHVMGTQPPRPLSPVRVATRSTTPTLRWEPVAKAQGYTVRIVSYAKDEGNERIVWNYSVEAQTQLSVPEGYLRPGRVYFWQVETLIKGRASISPVVGFWVLDKKALRQVELAEREYKSSALVLAGVYAKYGLYEEAIAQIERLAAQNPDNPSVQVILRKLRLKTGT